MGPRRYGERSRPLIGKSTFSDIFILTGVYRNLFRWTMRTSGDEYRSSFFIANDNDNDDNNDNDNDSTFVMLPAF